MEQELLLESKSDEGVNDLAKLAGQLNGFVKFRDMNDAKLSIIWVSQCWLGTAVLPENFCAYLSFTGPKSAGKSTATEIMAQLGSGEYIEGGTNAAIRDKLNKKPRCLGIDEIDTQMRKLPDLEGMLRTGARWHATYPLRVPDSNGGWKTEDVNIGGPKVLNYRTDPEDALATRSITIELEQWNDVNMICDNFYRGPLVNELRDSISNLSDRARNQWDVARMQDHIEDPKFKERVVRIKTKLPRDTEMAAYLLATADSMGWVADDVLSEYFARSEEDSLQHLREILRGIVEKHQEDIRNGVLGLRNKDVHPEVNRRLLQDGLDPIGEKEWKRVRRELGIRDSNDQKGILLRFDDKARKAIGAD